MENFPKKKRGRPRKIPESPSSKLGFVEMPKPVRDLLGYTQPTERTRANEYYAEGAREVVEAYRKQVKGLQVPHDPMLHAKLRLGMDWILGRRTVLTELGRMMDANENPTEQEIGRFQDVIWHIAQRHDKMTAKAACAYIRRQRLGGGSRRERVSSLHRDLNTAINLHRKRFPESSWEDVQKALDLTARQVGRKAK